MTTARMVMTFHSEAAQDGALLVAAAEGVEALGQPFRFDLDLVSDDPHLDLAALLQVDARLTMNRTTVLADGRQVAYDYDYHGKLASIRQVGRAGARRFRYRAVLRSHLWQLSRSRRSRIYTKESLSRSTVPGLLEKILTDAKLDFEFQFANEGRYPIHPYMVQYEETDLDFITRWMEQEGICHYYSDKGKTDTNKPKRGTLVFTDHPGGYLPLGASQRVEFSDLPQQGWGSGETPHIVRLEVEDTPVPLRVQLKEYNYEAPANKMLYEAEVDPKGVGVWYEYNSNFRSESEGRFLAMVRRDYWRGRARRLYGETDHRGFQCGRTFTPVRHYNQHVSDRDFVLIEVCHKLDQGDGDEAASSGSYSCTFTAMPADLPYRPERETPWPSIHGVVHGRVAGGALGYAELDDMGRYKIDVDYDLNDQTIAKVRMAQPSVGEDAGMHFPLRQNTEVLIGHIDGDPDKPVILGAVHDAEKTNLLDHALDPLGTKSSIKSQGGNLIEMNDEPGYKRLTMANGSFSMVQSFGRPECLHDPNDEASASNPAGGPRKGRAAERGVGRQADGPRLRLPADTRTEASSAHHADAIPADSLQVSASGGGSLQRPNKASLMGTMVKGSALTGTTTITWSKISGPGTVTFGNAAALNTSAQFSADGTYVLRLNVSVKPSNKAAVTAHDEVTVVVAAEDRSLQVNATCEGPVQMPDAASLNGIVVKGRQVTGAVTVAWSKKEGPGTVDFSNASALETSATFSVEGTYVLTLTITSTTSAGTSVTGSDDVTVAVSAEDTALQVSASSTAETVARLSSVSLTGDVVQGRQVTGTVTKAWTMVRGPAAPTFSAPAALNTTATFSAIGTYVLRLTVTWTPAGGTPITKTADVTVEVELEPETNVPASFSAEGTSDSAVANSAMSSFWANVAGKWTANGKNTTTGAVPDWKATALAEFKALYNTPAPVDCKDYGGHDTIATPTAASDFPDYMGSLGTAELTSVTVPGMASVGTTDPDPLFANYAASAGGNQSFTIGDAIDITHGNSWEYQEGNTVGYQKGDSHDFRLSGTSHAYNWSPREVTWNKGDSKNWSYSDDTYEWSYAKVVRNWSKCKESYTREQMEYSHSYTNVTGTQVSRTEAGSIEEYQACGGSTSMSIGGPSFEISLNVVKVAIEAAVAMEVDLSAKVNIKLAASLDISLAASYEISMGTKTKIETVKDTDLTVTAEQVTAMQTQKAALVTAKAALDVTTQTAEIAKKDLEINALQTKITKHETAITKGGVALALHSVFFHV